MIDPCAKNFPGFGRVPFADYARTHTHDAGDFLYRACQRPFVARRIFEHRLNAAALKQVLPDALVYRGMGSASSSVAGWFMPEPTLDSHAEFRLDLGAHITSPPIRPYNYI